MRNCVIVLPPTIIEPAIKTATVLPMRLGFVFCSIVVPHNNQRSGIPRR